jgi:hypothetical protein
VPKTPPDAKNRRLIQKCGLLQYSGGRQFDAEFVGFVNAGDGTARDDLGKHIILQATSVLLRTASPNFRLMALKVDSTFDVR